MPEEQDLAPQTLLAQTDSATAFQRGNPRREELFSCTACSRTNHQRHRMRLRFEQAQRLLQNNAAAIIATNAGHLTISAKAAGREHLVFYPEKVN